MLVSKGNRQIRTSREALQSYLDKGYDQIDENTGEVLSPGKQTDASALEAENKKLKAEIKKLQKAAKKGGEAEADEEPEEVAEPKDADAPEGE